MKKAFLGFLAAIFLHAVVFLFGGFLIPKGDKAGPKKDVLQEVDIAKEDDKKKDEEEPKEKLEEPVEDIKQEMTDLRELAQVEAPASSAPALSNMSLSDLGSALGGAGGDGGFGGGVGFASGGVIGGSGSGGGGVGGADMLSSGQLDSKPTPTNRVPPKLSAELRKRVKGKVDVLIIVGKDGSVSKAEVLDSPDPAVNPFCIEAAREWRFQPGTRDGKPVSFKLKLPFRFD